MRRSRTSPAANGGTHAKAVSLIIFFSPVCSSLPSLERIADLCARIATSEVVEQRRCIYNYYMDHSEIGRAIGAECLCFRARRVSRVLTRHFDEALRPLGIQATQLTLLGSIAGPGPGGQTMPRLVEMLAMDATTLSRNLRPLEKAGLVAIGRSDKDKRSPQPPRRSASPKSAWTHSLPRPRRGSAPRRPWRHRRSPP
jgi:DNA-binding transcriptional ArsR family regulator